MADGKRIYRLLSFSFLSFFLFNKKKLQFAIFEIKRRREAKRVTEAEQPFNIFFKADFFYWISP